MTRRFIAVEFHGKAEPYRGDGDDDRPLGTNGGFMSGYYKRTDVAEFESEREAWTAAKKAPRRESSLLGVFELGVQS